MTSPQPHQAAVLKRLLELEQQQEVFTDMELHLKDGTVRVSRNRFAAISDVFKQMLVTRMVEGRERVVKMEYVSMDTWRCVCQFYFMDEKCVSDSNVMDILEFSHMYQVEELQEYCCSFLHACLDVETCLAIWRDSRLFRLTALKAKAQATIARNFLQVGKQEDFLELKSDEVLELLDMEDLVTTEDELCSAVVRWMEKNDADDDTVLSLFNCVSLPKLSDAMITQLQNNPRLSCNPSVYSQLVEEQMKMLDPGTRRSYDPIPHRRGHPRENIVVVGYFAGQLCIYSWSPETKKWTTLFSTNYCPQFSSIKLKDSIIVTGGLEAWDEIAGKRTTFFHLKTTHQSAGPMLNRARCSHVMAVIGNAAFVVGGETMNRNLKSIEMYDNSSSCNNAQWETVGHLLPGVGSVLCVEALGCKLLIAVEEVVSAGFQTFDLNTRTAARLSVLIPGGPPYMTGVSFLDEVYFLDCTGRLSRLREKRDGTILYRRSHHLENFLRRENFGLTFDGSRLTVYGGEEGGFSCPSSLSSEVSCFDVHGRRLEDGDLKNLPRGLRVHGVFHTRAGTTSSEI